MELYQVRYFLALAETLNFTRASERVFVSQPALTKAIRRLEETLGAPLFDRTKNAVRLTDLGIRLLPSLRQLHEHALGTREEARRLARRRTERVQLGVMCTLDFGRLLAAFADHPPALDGIEVVFREGSLEALTEALDQGLLDLAVLASPHGWPKRFAVTPLYRDDLVLAFGDDHRFGGRREIEAAELHRERYCERTACEFSSFLDRVLGERGIELEVVQRSAREDWIQALVLANFGVAFMPASLADRAALDRVTTPDLPLAREVVLVAPAERPAEPTVRAVAQALHGHAMPA